MRSLCACVCVVISEPVVAHHRINGIDKPPDGASSNREDITIVFDTFTPYDICILLRTVLFTIHPVIYRVPVQKVKSAYFVVIAIVYCTE